MDIEKLADLSRPTLTPRKYKGKDITVQVFPVTRKSPVKYQARKTNGAGKVTSVYRCETGYYVVIHDKQRRGDVAVRPNQVSS